MATAAQIAASRSNGARGRGPVTQAGRERSRLNALRHGLCAATQVLPGESDDELDGLVGAVLAELGPADAMEAQLAERAAVLIWRLARAGRLETELYDHRRLTAQRDEVKGRWHERQRREDSPESFRHERHVQGAERHAVAELDAHLAQRTLAAGFLADARGENAFAKLSRYETTLQRALTQTLAQLHKLQDRRALTATAVEVGGEAPGSAGDGDGATGSSDAAAAA